MKDRHLISADELRAAGALYVPPAWRKSLSAGTDPRPERKSLFVQRDLFSDPIDDVEPPSDGQGDSPADGDDNDDEEEEMDDLP